MHNDNENKLIIRLNIESNATRSMKEINRMVGYHGHDGKAIIIDIDYCHVITKGKK